MSKAVLRLLDSWAKRPANGYLFFGPSNPEKQQVAERFSRKLLGETSSAPSHPDFMVLQPEEGKKFIAVDAVRDVRARLAEKPLVGARMVLFVPQADRLQEEGLNCLLKVLEEPRAGAVIVFVVDAISRMPATILSRMVPVPFQPTAQREARQDAERFLQARTVGERLEIIEVTAKSCEASDDAQEAWRIVLDGWAESFRRAFSTQTHHAVVGAHGVVAAYRFLGSPFSPRLALEAAAVRMHAPGSLSLLFPSQLPSSFPSIFSLV